MGLFGKKKQEQYTIADVYSKMRTHALTADPAKLGLAREKSGAVWGLLMETGHKEGIVTLVALGDGTVSLYFSNGGGAIGLGKHEGPSKAAAELLAAASPFLWRAQPASEYPLPANSRTRFYFLTFDGIRTAEASENELGYNKHPLSPLFHKAHKVIFEATPYLK